MAAIAEQQRGNSTATAMPIWQNQRSEYADTRSCASNGGRGGCGGCHGQGEEKGTRGKLAVLEARQAAAAFDQVAVLALAAVDLANTIVRAPIGGSVANRQVRVGRYVTPGAPILVAGLLTSRGLDLSWPQRAAPSA